MEKLINCCPHDIVVYRGETKVLEIPRGETVARVQFVEGLDRTILGVPVYKKTKRSVKGLPKPKKDTTYIVSNWVLEVASSLGREDLVSPDSKCGSVRSEDNTLLGITCFRR